MNAFVILDISVIRLVASISMSVETVKRMVSTIAFSSANVLTHRAVMNAHVKTDLKVMVLSNVLISMNVLEELMNVIITLIVSIVLVLMTVNAYLDMKVMDLNVPISMNVHMAAMIVAGTRFVLIPRAHGLATARLVSKKNGLSME